MSVTASLSALAHAWGSKGQVLEGTVEALTSNVEIEEEQRERRDSSDGDFHL